MGDGSLNLIPFSERSKDEARQFGKKGGKASGETRRKKADFRKMLNMLLTTKIDNPEWTPVLEAMGLDSTLESAVNMAIIKQALDGDPKAYTAVRDTLGQSTKSDLEIEKQKIEIEKQRAEIERERVQIEKQKAELEKLKKEMDPAVEQFETDEFIKALKGQAKDTFKDVGDIIET